jgi:hypothetical protein
LFHGGREYCQTGEVVEQPHPDVVLIKFDRQDPEIPPTILAFAVSELLTFINDKGFPEAEWEFFNTRAELDAYQEWLFEESPETKPKIVKIVPR